LVACTSNGTVAYSHLAMRGSVVVLDGR
jgi:hypothetical protein